MKHSVFQGIALAVLALAFPSIYAQATMVVTVSGKVVDSTGLPVADAMVLTLSDTTFVLNSLDSIVTKKDGTFSKQITVPKGTALLGYGVIKPGYQLSYGIGLVLLGSSNFGTTILKRGSPGKPTAVSGRVIDSLSGLPVGDAMVRLTAISGAAVNPPDSARTSVDGKFSLTMLIDTSSIGPITSRIGYSVEKSDYQTKMGSYIIQGVGEIKIGDMPIRTVLSAVRPLQRAAFRPMPASATFYSLRGQELLLNRFSGAHATSQPIIILHRYPTNQKAAEKIMLVR
jgi:hypothetical protein